MAVVFGAAVVSRRLRLLLLHFFGEIPARPAIIYTWRVVSKTEDSEAPRPAEARRFFYQFATRAALVKFQAPWPAAAGCD